MPLKQSKPVTLLMTAWVGIMVVGFPLLVARRLLFSGDQSSFGSTTRSSDLLLFLAGLVWLGLVAALLVVRRPLRAVPLVPRELQAAFRRTIAMTLFGSATIDDERGSTDLSQLVQPDVTVETVRAAPVVAAAPAARPKVTVPLMSYVVGRRESWWSIAEQILGDGKRWSELVDLNRGDSPAPGIELDESVTLVPGWSIQVPATNAESAES